MNRTTIIVAVGLALAGALPAAPAAAQASRTFVSPTGSDSNNCSLAAPCRSFAAAFAVTNASGEIAVLGTAGYGALTIDKAISIVNPGGFEAGITVPPGGGTGILINAGVNDAVSLRGLTIEGGGSGQTGILFNTGGSLTIANSVIRHVIGNAIQFVPNASSSLSVSNTLVADNGSSGIFVNTSGSGAVTAVFNRVEANNNGVHGVLVWGGISTGTLNATVYDSVAARNGNGGFNAAAGTGHAPTTLMVFNSVAANNDNGLVVGGTGATLRAFQTMVTGNANGWSTDGIGVVQSYGNNAIDGNGSNETAPPSVAQK